MRTSRCIEESRAFDLTVLTFASHVNSCRGRETYSFFVFLLGGALFFSLLEDAVESEAEASHAGKVTQVDVEQELLVPHRV